MTADGRAEGPPRVSRTSGGEEKRLVCHRVMRSERNGKRAG
jgi:hypothetical protein